MKKLALFGPHDRFNYGDLLFAIMLEYGLNKIKPNYFRFKKYSLVDADFTSKGGFKTHKYSVLKNDINNGEVDALIVAGGESLRADWNGLYSFINPIYFKIFRHPRISKSLKKDIYIQKLLGGKSENPFLINKSDFKKDFKIIYNAVGGGHNMELPKVQRLKVAHYISFREKASTDFIKEQLPAKTVNLCPDSAVIMSDVYPKESFLDGKNIRPEVLHILKNDSYIYFQLSKYKNSNKLKEAVEQLQNLAVVHHLKIVLCPIGTAKGHEDHEPLQYIHSKLKNESIYIDTPTVEEIMALIAYSKLYIGNSLHGIITAMSYNLPYVGLNSTQQKIVRYLEAWGIDELNKMQEVDNFLIKSQDILNNDTLSDKIKTQTDLQKTQYYQALEEIIKAIEL